MADDDLPEPPTGFVPFPSRGHFSEHVGPYFQHSDGTQAFFVLERHCNSLGVLHGGMASAFLDSVLAGAVAKATGKTPVTMHLSIDFLDMGRAGHWVLAEGSLTRAVGDIAYAEGRLRMGALRLARATGVFKLMQRRAR